MKKITVIGSICLVFLFSSDRAWGKNSCISCHQEQTQSKRLEHNYADWKKSIHASKGIGCDACHGGHSDTFNPVNAHEGVLSSRDKNSPIYFQNIPKTCGQCHVEELKEFQKSVHYKLLEDSGKGPNCLTCHGSMATTILAHSQLDQTCSLCHGKPIQAAKALSLIQSIKNSLDVLQKKKGQYENKEKITEFWARYREIQKKWHSFDIAALTNKSKELLKEIKEFEKKCK
ncbi:MAG: multiheme c-type cytochrome [Deltaproteobacteria bacterium]|nr:multiheme c-type cytochrome [Deltaproteobacteria bacterium]